MSKINGKLNEFDEFLNDFLGSPRQLFNIQTAHIKTAIDNLAILRTDFDSHIKKFNGQKVYKNLGELRTEYDDHLTKYNEHTTKFETLQKNFSPVNNVLKNLFDKDTAVRLADVTILIPNIIDNQQKNTGDINDIKDKIKNINDVGFNIIKDQISELRKFVNDKLSNIAKITEIEQKLQDIESGIPIINERVEKIKIDHPVDQVKKISYVVNTGVFHWVNNPIIEGLNISIKRANELPGLYRFTLITTKSFKLSCFVNSITNVELARGINTLIYNHTTPNVYITASYDDATFLRLSIPYVLEYLGPQII